MSSVRGYMDQELQEKKWILCIHFQHPIGYKVSKIRSHKSLRIQVTSVENKEWKPGVEAGCEDGKLVGIDQYSHKNKENSTYDRNNAHMFFEPVKIFEEGIDPQRCKEERDSQA